MCVHQLFATVRNGGAPPSQRDGLALGKPIFSLLIKLLLFTCELPAICAGGQTPVPSDVRSPFVLDSRTEVTSISPQLRSVSAPATNLWTFNAIEDYDPDWHSQVFYITSFVVDGATGRPGQLIELDVVHHRARAWTLPIGIGSWALLKARDGRLYMGSYNGGTLLSFDPRTKLFIPIPQLSKSFRRSESIITDIAQAPDGDIYYGTYPGGHLVRYEPDRHASTDLGQVSPDEMYLRWLAVTPSGTVLCGMGPRRARVIAYEPSTKSFRALTPADDQTPGAFSKPLVTPTLVVEAQHRPAGRVLIYNSSTLKLLRSFTVPQRNNGSGNQSAFTLLDERHLLYQDDDQKLMSLDLERGSRKVIFRSPGTAANNRWFLDSRGNLLGLLVQSYVYLDPRTQKITYAAIPLKHPAQEIRWLSTFPDGAIYGGPVLGQTFFSFDPANHRLRSYDQVNDRTGEIYYGIPLKGRIYTISYAEAGLSVFDPKKAWHPGESVSSNPRAIAYLPDGQYRPEGGLHIGPGGNIYIGTQPDYGLLGGALTVFDPSTEKLRVYRNIIPQEEVTAIATDDRYVYGAADPDGGGGSKSEATQAHFFVWDPATHAIVWDHAFPDAHGINALAASNGHVYFAREDQLLDFNLEKRSVASVYHFDHAAAVPSESLKVARDGSIFGIFGNEVGRYTPTTGTMQLFAETRGHATSGLALGTDGAVYFGNHTDMWVYMPEHPSPPASFGQ